MSVDDLFLIIIGAFCLIVWLFPGS